MDLVFGVLKSFCVREKQRERRVLGSFLCCEVRDVNASRWERCYGDVKREQNYMKYKPEFLFAYSEFTPEINHSRRVNDSGLLAWPTWLPYSDMSPSTSTMYVHLA